MDRKNSKEFEHIGGLIRELMTRYKRSMPDSEMTRIFGLWHSAMDENIAANTRPTAFKGSLLMVNVVSSPWMQQLQYLKKEMIRNINRALGKELIKDIKFKIGPV